MNTDYLTLILTYNCKESCHFCLIEKNNLSLNEKIAKKIIYFFIANGGQQKTIKFFGGDPLLEFDLLKKVVYFSEDKIKAANKLINFIFPTPGTHLTKDILNFINLHQIELILDSMHIKRIKDSLYKHIFSLPFLTLTINIPPYSTKNLFNEFKKYYNCGFRRFNFLPVYYIRWSKKAMEALKEEFAKIKIFYREHPALYFKNSDFRGDVPLFNSCLTSDISGNLFSSNMVLFKNLSKFKNEVFLGNIQDIDKKQDLAIDNNNLLNIVKRSFSKRVLRDTFAVDKVLNTFVNSLQRQTKVADIKLGNSCNNFCKFCVRRKKREKIIDKESEEIMQNFKKAREECEAIIFSGGEPSVRKDLFQLLWYAKRLGYKRIQIQTNGRMFAYKDFCQQTIDAGGNEFEISVHGHTPQLHDYLTSSPGSFYQLMKAFRNLKKLNQLIFTNTVITKSSYRHLPQIAQLLVSLGIKQFQFAFVHPLGSAEENFASVVPRISMVMPYVKKGLDIGIKAGITVMTEGIPYCFLDGYEDYAAEKIIPSTKIFEFSDEVIDFDKIRPEMAKAKGKNCIRCRCFSVCEGIWREYPERFGWNEFTPMLHI